MAEASIPVDLRNPGQVFACLGLMEATQILFGPCEGAFGGENANTTTIFTLNSPSDNPVEDVLTFLLQAKVEAVGHTGCSPYKPSWRIDMRALDSELAAHEAAKRDKSGELKPDPTLPTVFACGDRTITVSSWGDTSRSGRDNVKFWAGSAGMPGTRLVRDALDLVGDLKGDVLTEASRNPFAIARPQSSSFNFDRRRIAPALDAGFSVDKQDGRIVAVGYPLVEILAAIGLENARPARINPRDKLAYRYGVSSARLPTVLARAVLGGQGLGFPIRLFRMQLGWPGQEGQARCIIDAQEEFA